MRVAAATSPRARSTLLVHSPPVSRLITLANFSPPATASHSTPSLTPYPPLPTTTTITRTFLATPFKTDTLPLKHGATSRCIVHYRPFSLYQNQQQHDPQHLPPLSSLLQTAPRCLPLHGCHEPQRLLLFVASSPGVVSKADVPAKMAFVTPQNK